MIKTIKGISLFLAVFVFLSVGGFYAFAHELSSETGFVEYQAEASINFTEIIEVTLTDKETGYYYTHKLYRANDYAGNFSVPFGTYSVEAKVNVISGEFFSTYEVVGLPDEISVSSSTTAVPISLRVEEFTAADVSVPNWSFDGEKYEEFVSENTETELPDAEEFIVSSGPDEYFTEEGSDLDTDGKPAGKSSIWFGVFSSIIIFCIGAAVFWVIKNRKSEE